MIRMLGVLVLIVAVVAGLGFYLGWFHFSWGNARVTVSVDEGRIQADKDKAVDKVKDLEHQAKDKVETATQKAQE